MSGSQAFKAQAPVRHRAFVLGGVARVKRVTQCSQAVSTAQTGRNTAAHRATRLFSR